MAYSRPQFDEIASHAGNILNFDTRGNRDAIVFPPTLTAGAAPHRYIGSLTGFYAASPEHLFRVASMLAVALRGPCGMLGSSVAHMLRVKGLGDWPRCWFGQHGVHNDACGKR